MILIHELSQKSYYNKSKCTLWKYIHMYSLYIYTLYIYAHTHIHSVYMIIVLEVRVYSVLLMLEMEGDKTGKEGLFWRYKGFCRFCYRGRQGIKVGLRLLSGSPARERMAFRWNKWAKAPGEHRWGGMLSLTRNSRVAQLHFDNQCLFLMMLPQNCTFESNCVLLM